MVVQPVKVAAVLPLSLPNPAMGTRQPAQSAHFRPCPVARGPLQRHAAAASAGNCRGFCADADAAAGPRGTPQRWSSGVPGPLADPPAAAYSGADAPAGFCAPAPGRSCRGGCRAAASGCQIRPLAAAAAGPSCGVPAAAAAAAAGNWKVLLQPLMVDDTAW